MSGEQKPKSPEPKPEATTPGAEPSEPAWDPRQKLRELDTLNVEFGNDFFEGLHDRIMARIEKTEIEMPESELSDLGVPLRRKASAQNLTLINSAL